jgi:hypothetical protein
METAPTPTTTTRPTLITKELAMRGAAHEGRLGLRPGEQGKLHEIVGMTARMSREFDRTFSVVYGYYDEHDRLVCCIGTDERGQVCRLYDILSLHEPSSPATPDPEEYTYEYVSVLNARYESYGAHRYLMESTFRMTSTEAASHRKDVKAIVDDWLSVELAAYVNRYCAVISTPWSFVVSKRVDLVDDVQLVRIQRHDVKTFVGASVYDTLSVPGNERKTIAAWWMQSPRRASYERIVYSARPQERELNLWHGFPIRHRLSSANPERAIPVLSFIRDVIADGDVQVSNYIIRWLAWIVQRPLDRPGVALVAPQDLSTSFIFCEVMGRILGPYHRYAQNVQEYDRFTRTSASCRMLVLHGSDYSKRQASLLGTYMTSDTLTLEAKGARPDIVENHVGAVILTDGDSGAHPDPLVEVSGRRYVIKKTCSTRCEYTVENQAYWKELREVRNEDVYARLMEINLDGWTPTDVPNGEAAGN